MLSRGLTTIAVPVSKQTTACEILPLAPNVPRLFCDFPLLGTEAFPFPVVINNPTFYPTEPRDGIFLTKTDRPFPQIDHNKGIIEEALALYLLLLDHASENDWQNLSSPRRRKASRQYGARQARSGLVQDRDPQAHAGHAPAHQDRADGSGHAGPHPFRRRQEQHLVSDRSHRKNPARHLALLQDLDSRDSCQHNRTSRSGTTSSGPSATSSRSTRSPHSSREDDTIENAGRRTPRKKTSTNGSMSSTPPETHEPDFHAVVAQAAHLSRTRTAPSRRKPTSPATQATSTPRSSTSSNSSGTTCAITSSIRRSTTDLDDLATKDGSFVVKQITAIDRQTHQRPGCHETAYRPALAELLLWFHENPDHARRSSSRSCTTNKHRLYDDEEILDNIKRADQLKQLLSAIQGQER